MSRSYCIALFDWDTHFVQTLRVWAESTGASIVHMESPTDFGAYTRGGGEIDLILVDVDTFRIDHGSPLGQVMASCASDVLTVCLTQSKERVDFEITPGVAQFICLPKEHFVLHYDGLIQPWIGSTQEVEAIGPKPQQVPARQDTLKERVLSTGRLEQSLKLHHALLVSDMTLSASGAVENTAQVLLSAIEQLSDSTHKSRDVMGDLEWVYKNISKFAQTMKEMQPKPVTQGRVDIRHTINHVIGLLKRTGRSKYIGIEAKLGTQPVWVQIEQGQLEQMLTRLLCLSIDAVIEAQATFRRVHVRLRQNNLAQRVELEVEDFAGPSYHEVLLSGDCCHVYGQSVDFIQDLIRHHGGLFRREPSSRGTVLQIELPLDGAIDVTAPRVSTPRTTAPPERRGQPGHDEATEVMDSAPVERVPSIVFDPQDTLDIPITQEDVFRIIHGGAPTDPQEGPPGFVRPPKKTHGF